MATDVSKMSASQLDKMSAKIEKRRQELSHQEVLTQMKAVAKKHGVSFTDVIRLHSAKLPKAPTKTARNIAAKTGTKVSVKAKPQPAAKKTSKPSAKPAKKEVAKAAPKSGKKTNVVSKAKYKNPDNPKQTWSGMGRKPAWLVAHLDAGKKLQGLAV